MSMRSIKIEETMNGYVLTEQDSENLNKYVVQEKIDVLEEDSMRVEQEAFVRMVLELQDMLGIYNSKHNKYRINIELVDKTGKEVELE